MKPTFWQLRNRIKWVERLRGNVDEELHSHWENGCGVCVMGSALRTMRGPKVKSNLRSIYEPVIQTIEGKEFLHIPEVQLISEFLGLNYLEIRRASNKYEGYHARGLVKGKFMRLYRPLSHAEIADWVEEIHITPYLYMIERHFKRPEKILNETLV